MCWRKERLQRLILFVPPFLSIAPWIGQKSTTRNGRQWYRSLQNRRLRRATPHFFCATSTIGFEARNLPKEL
jgi:hypothetical protein